jgi:predicted KAP-like P-loop ATPase
MSFDADRPIHHPRHDQLGLSAFAQALATSLMEIDPREGLALSVEAPWGGGQEQRARVGDP